MDSLLRRLGKKTTVVCDDVFPKRLSILSEKRWNDFKHLKKNPPSYQAIVMTDCPNLERIGRVRELIKPDTVIFNIDHHVSNQRFGHYNLIRPEASACGEIVFEIAKRLRMPLTREEAKNIYISIATDTGSFKYSNTTVRCHRIASELISSGIDIEKINNELYSTYSLNKIHLYSRLLGRVKTLQKGRIAWVGMTSQDLVKSGANYEDAEGFIDFLKYLKEVKIAFFMIEMKQNKKIRVSFRSKGRYDVNKIASYLGGGGHKKAAGCMLSDSLQQTEKKILNCIQKVYRTL